MFGRYENRGRRSTPLPFVIFRTVLSLTMLTIFGLGVYQAYTHFSGIDPLKMDPKTAISSFLSSPESAKVVSNILGVSLPGFSGLKNRLKVILPSGNPNSNIPSTSTIIADPSRPTILKFALVSDSHNDNANLKKALGMAKEKGVKFVIGLGDFSDVGTLDELQKAKNEFLASNLPYYVTAGDHDLWDSRDKGKGSSANFLQVFGPTYQSFSDSGVRFIILHDADNYQGIDSLQMKWLEDEILKVEMESASRRTKALFILTHEPFYHPSSDHFMGKTDPKLAFQAGRVTSLAKEANVSEIFAGDAHYYTRYTDPKTDIKMTTIGAVTSQRNAQAPRFSIIDVYQDGSYNVEDLEIK